MTKKIPKNGENAEKMWRKYKKSLIKFSFPKELKKPKSLKLIPK